MSWVKVRSWHITRWVPIAETTATGMDGTLCGQKGPFTGYAEELPLDEKSCESCLRIQERANP